MSESDKNYELQVLKMVINKYLDESTSITEESIYSLEVKHDQVIWDLATRIFRESGHKIELTIVRDAVNSRIEKIRHQLTLEKECIARQVAEKDRYIASVSTELGVDKTTTHVFLRVIKIISEQLGIQENTIKLDSYLVDDLGIDPNSCNLYELITSLEENFKIEFSDTEIECGLDISYRGTVFSPFARAGYECTVRNFVEIISSKLSC